MAELTQVIAITAIGVLAGLMVAEAVMLLPALARTDPATGKALQVPAAEAGWRIGPAVGVPGVLATAVSLLVGSRSDTEIILSALALAAIAGGLAITMTAYKRTELGLRQLPLERPPAEHAAALAGLRRLHNARTVLFLLGFALVATAGVLS